MIAVLKTRLLTRSVPRKPISPEGLKALGEALQGLGISFHVDPNASGKNNNNDKNNLPPR